jgi:hypothetical protein
MFPRRKFGEMYNDSDIYTPTLFILLPQQDAYICILTNFRTDRD